METIKGLLLSIFIAILASVLALNSM